MNVGLIKGVLYKIKIFSRKYFFYCFFYIPRVSAMYAPSVILLIVYCIDVSTPVYEVL